MTDWKMDGKRAIRVTPECSIQDNDLESLVHIHNADIAELKLRLARIVNWCAENQDHYPLGAEAIALAEGRDR